MKNVEKILLYLVSFSVGALLGDAFIHLIPESFEELEPFLVGVYVLSGILFSFVIEKFIHWRHCHIKTSKMHPHRFVYMNLIGDSFHNFIDGLIIAGSYFVSIPVGIATTIAVVFHEIPQEIGDFGVMIYGGFSKIKALLFNFLTALTAVIGALIGIFLSGLEPFLSFLIPFAAGNFIYIAGTDLIPELHKSEHVGLKSFLQLIAIILGMLVMISLLLLE
jgi:zinc and cadmium transporter